MYDLKGQVALVTGAGGEHGIGYAIARRLAEEGADVVVNDVSARPYPDAEWAGLDAAVSAIEALGRRSACVVADVGDPQQVDRMVAETLEKMGRIDILVNNAGTLAGWDRVPVVELEVDLFDAVQRTNVRGTYLVSRAVARHMLERGGGGRVINISSIAGRTGTARYSAYNASKFAVIGFSQALAQELAPAGITVNTICPGLVETERVVPLAMTALPDLDPEPRLRQFLEGYAARNPIGRVADPDDVANTAAFLASAEAAYLTGIAMNVCGGVRMD
ncbi:MAG: glucose 1-dehydrogenase [Spirochaetaceae bacterium]|nr:glucose 1-dehydrogenase [Spirochaetaceae bacterium]MDE0447485.1 glucose 1-dehydrogenase [Spirochaetaceae bacterium]